MKRLLPLLVLLGCGGEAKPPTACAEVPQVTVAVDESVTVTICFEDPEGGTLKLVAASADDEIATAGLRGDNVWVQGKKPGTTTVTVTATDPDNMSGTLDFSVLVPNQPPSGAMADMTLPVGIDPMVNLAKTYTDPDGTPLTYTASSSASAVVSVAVTDSFLTIATMRGGVATVTVTASDGEGEHTDMFDVTAEPALFSDNFASAGSLDDWVLGDSATAEVEDSRLVLTAVNAGFYGLAIQEFGGEAEDWTVDAALRPTDDGLAAFFVVTGDERIQFYLFMVGEADLGLGPYDWHFAWFDSQAGGGQGGLLANPDWSLGISDDIDDDVTANISMTLTGDDGLSVMLNGEEIIAPRTGNFLFNTAVEFALGTAAKPNVTGATVSRMGWVGFRAEDFTEDEDEGPQAYRRPDFTKLKIRPVQHK